MQGSPGTLTALFQPGERWVSNCQDCVCHEGSRSVQCTPMPCEAQERPPQCSGAGFVTVTRPLANNSCCLETLCGELSAPPAGG